MKIYQLIFYFISNFNFQAGETFLKVVIGGFKFVINLLLNKIFHSPEI